MIKSLINYIKYDDVKRMYLLRELYSGSKYNLSKKIIRRIYKKIMKRNCASIPIESDVYATFPHGISGIFISEKAKIGKDCVIFQQVTIGSNTLNDTKRQGSPTIGDSVYISAGAKIIGNINVADHVRIGANAVVYQDVPSNSTVVLEKNRIIKKDQIQDNRFIDISFL